MKLTLLFSLLLAVCAPSFAADAPVNRYAATIAPLEKFDSGVLAVEKHGSKGRPLILIPGLASGAWAWQNVVRDLVADYTVYIVTLPGFDGRPFAVGDGVETARAGLRTLIASRKLDHPVLIGHSMGALLGFAVAEDVPGAIGGVVALDGYPVFPGTEQMPPAQRSAMAAGMKAQMAGADQAAFAKQQQSYMRISGVMDMAQADQLALLSGRSDPAAVATYMSEVLALDLRDKLPAITAPILMLAPYYGQDPMDGRWTPDAKVTYVHALLAGAPNVQVVPVIDSRHFIMFDQPQVLNKLLRDYLKAL